MSTPQMDVPQVSSNLFSGLLHITTGAVMNRLVHEAGRGNGLEVWRLIYQEWKNKSPQVMSTYRLAYENPIRCKGVEDVRAKMAEWLNYATEYELNTGYKFNDHGRLEALKRFCTRRNDQTD